MSAFHGSQELKGNLIKQLEAHYAADEIVKGQYWEDGKGCAVGCCIHGSSHELMSETYGIPIELCNLLDVIFEGLENSAAKEFPLQFVKAIPVGADLSRAWSRFAVWLLTDPVHGIARLHPDPSINAVANLHQILIDGGRVGNPAKWGIAASGVNVDICADKRTRSIFQAAVDAATWNAGSAANNAADANAAAAARDAGTDWDTARYAARLPQSVSLLKILSECN